MNKNTIFSGHAQIISSGLAIQYNKEPISIKILLTGFEFELIFKFVDDKNSKTKNVTPEIFSLNSAMLTFTNFNDPLGTGSTSPMKIGHYKGQQISLHYRVYSLVGSPDKTIHYTFYLSEEDK